MYETSYHRPTSIDEAVKLVGDSGGEGKFLSGGMTLIPTMKQRLAAPTALVDLRHICSPEGHRGEWQVGEDRRRHHPWRGRQRRSAEGGLSRLRQSGRADRRSGRAAHMGTIGGFPSPINDPAADYPAALLALGGTVHTNTRQIPADEFFVSMFETALADDEIVTAVSFEAPDHCAYEKFSQSGLALCHGRRVRRQSRRRREGRHHRRFDGRCLPLDRG